MNTTAHENSTTSAENVRTQLLADLGLTVNDLPLDGRFGCGPSLISPSNIAAISDSGLMGTSHRQAPVKNLVASVRAGLRDLYRLPEGWEIVLGNGGATAFWAVAATSLVHHRAAHAVFGEFGSKFASETDSAPHLGSSVVVKAPAGDVAVLTGEEEADVFAYPHHETSTGALCPLYRPSRHVADPSSDTSLTLVDATSIAGGIDIDITTVDAYYFSPQKCFGSDGGLWVALLSPAAQDRARKIKASVASGKDSRWMPQILDLTVALDNSVKEQTLNTPALATLIMMNQQIQWMLREGGLPAMEERSRTSSRVLYEWAESSGHAQPFVTAPAHRSPVVVTLDFTEKIDAKALARDCRTLGIVDIDPYRGLGGNQLRIATFPSVASQDTYRLIEVLNRIIEKQLS